MVVVVVVAVLMLLLLLLLLLLHLLQLLLLLVSIRRVQLRVVATTLAARPDRSSQVARLRLLLRMLLALLLLTCSIAPSRRLPLHLHRRPGITLARSQRSRL